MNSLTIVNFQKHKKLEIELDENVTSIVGLSDQGKTSIFRAIRWLAFNRPNGTRYIRHGSNLCKVTLADNKNKVSKKRGKGKNYYIVNGLKLEAFGSKVPKAVKRALRLTESNFQNQFDGPAWFTASPGQVAKKLNEIVDLSLLDRLQTTATAKLRKSKAQIELLQEDLKEQKEIIEKTKWIKQCRKDWKRICKREEEVEIAKKENKEIEKALHLLIESEEDNKWIVDMEKDFKEYIEKRESRDAFCESVRELDSLLTDYKNLKEKCEWTQNELEVVEQNLKKAQKKNRICPTCGQKIVKK